MPINQARMIALINAAADFRTGLEELCDIIKRETQDIIAGHQTYEGAFHRISIAGKSPVALLKFPLKSPAVIEIEQNHFLHNQNSNARRAESAARKRRVQGLPERGVITAAIASHEIGQTLAFKTPSQHITDVDELRQLAKTHLSEMPLQGRMQAYETPQNMSIERQQLVDREFQEYLKSNPKPQEPDNQDDLEPDTDPFLHGSKPPHTPFDGQT